MQIAEAVRHVLLNKTARIYPDEIIAGNCTSKRIGGILYPEMLSPAFPSVNKSSLKIRRGSTYSYSGRSKKDK